MSDVARSSDLGDSLGDYFDRRPVQAVQLTDPDVIARTGRWITENGGHCTWVSAYGSRAVAYAGAVSNRLALLYANGTSETAVLGDWIIYHRQGQFSMLSDAAFRECYEQTVRGEVTND